MKIAFVADPHIASHKRFGGPVESGINRRGWQCLEVLDKALQRAAELGCDAFVVLGDLFDSVRPEAQIVAEVQSAFVRAKTARDEMEILCLLGNHEFASTEDGDHALGPLRPVCHVVDTPELREFPGTHLLMLPFQPGKAEDYLKRTLVEGWVKHRGVPLLLCIHAGISDSQTPPWLRDAEDSIPLNSLHRICEEHAISAVFAGNWHERRIWLHGSDALTTQVGALVPTGFDNPDMYGYGGLVIWDNTIPSPTVVEIPGPRFLTSISECALHKQKWDEVDPWGSTERAYKVYVSLKAKLTDLDETRAYVAKLKAEGKIVDGEVLPDKEEADKHVRQAKAVALSAETLQDALGSYVSNMQLPSGVTAEDVLAKVRSYGL